MRNGTSGAERSLASMQEVFCPVAVRSGSVLAESGMKEGGVLFDKKRKIIGPGLEEGLGGKGTGLRVLVKVREQECWLVRGGLRALKDISDSFVELSGVVVRRGARVAIV